MTRVLPLPAPAKMSSGPSAASTASRCWGLSSSLKGKVCPGIGIGLVYPTRNLVTRIPHTYYRDTEPQNRTIRFFLCVSAPLWWVLLHWLGSRFKPFDVSHGRTLAAGTPLAEE